MDDATRERQIIELIEGLQGCKFTELVTKDRFLEIFRDPEGSGRLPPAEYCVAFVERMVEEGKLSAVEYVLPSLPYRMKTFLLPADADIGINQKGPRRNEPPVEGSPAAFGTAGPYGL